MKKLAIALKVLLCALLAAPASAQFSPQATAIPGSVPEGISYQGRLEDGGFPVNGTKTMVFRIYSAVSGGVLLWTGPAQSVSVSIGLFSATVPVPVTTLVGGGARYLEAQIDGTIMSPRELLNSVPYALIAKSVEGTIDVSTAGLAINANSAATQPALYISSNTGNVGVGTGSPSTSFDVGGSAQFGSGATKSTFTATGALNAGAMITAPDYTATYGVSAATGVFSGNLAAGGSVTAGTGAGTGLVVLNGAAGQSRALTGQTAGVNRWTMSLGNTTAEGGANAGSNFQLAAVSDAGAAIDSPIVIGRAATGDILLGQTGTRKVGIGTAGPRTALDIAAGVMSFGSATSSSAIQQDLSTDDLILTSYRQAADSDIIFRTSAGAAENTRMVIRGDGSVGIGTTTPVSPNAFARSLEISGTSNASLILSSINGVGTRWEMGSENTAGGLLGIFSGTSRIMSLLGSGNVGVGIVNPSALFQVGAGTLAVTSSGKVGIGVAGPNSVLDIRGNETNIWGAQPYDSTLALYSNTAAAVDVGPSLRFSGQSGAGVNPYTFGSIRGVKDAAGASYGGRLDFATIAGPEMGGLESTLGGRMSIDSAARIHINNSGFAKTAALWVEAMANHTYALQVSSQNNTGSLLAVRADGNVGIGTTAPNRTLHVQNKTGSADSMTLSNSDFVFGSVGTSLQFAALAATGNTAYGIQTWNGGETAQGNLLLQRFAGNVGIGSASPASKLHMSSGTLTIDGNAASAIQTIGNVGVGTGAAAPNDRLEVAGGNVRLTAVAGSAGSVKLFSILTVGAVTCTAQCGANTMCLAAWDSAGTSSTCGTSAANNRCLCSGFGN